MQHVNFQDLTGQPFGRWTVERQGPTGYLGGRKWWCRCQCGARDIIEENSLLSGHSTSCGCAKAERFLRMIQSHGQSRTPEYRIFTAIKQRCTNPKNEAYKNYGGRGITVEWESFEAFFADMGPRPSPKHTVERVNNNGPYARGNCTWALRKEQSNNMRTNRLIVYQDHIYTLSQLAEHLGLSKSGLRNRLARGTPLDAPRSHTHVRI